MVFVAEAMALWLDKGIWPTIVICAAPVGMGLVIASPTPLPFWAFGIWLLAAVAGLIAANRQRTRRRTQIAVGRGCWRPPCWPRSSKPPTTFGRWWPFRRARPSTSWAIR